MFDSTKREGLNSMEFSILGRVLCMFARIVTVRDLEHLSVFCSLCHLESNVILNSNQKTDN